MATKYVSPYAYLTIGYQEENKLFTRELPKYFFNEECYNLKNSLKDISMTVLFSVETLIDFNDFSNYLNNLSKHSKIIQVNIL